MAIWVMEIAGQAILAVGDIERDEADDLAADDAFQDDLMFVESDGKPLWDGTADIVVREASAEEVREWTLARAEASREDDFDEEEASVVFLVPVEDEDDD